MRLNIEEECFSRLSRFVDLMGIDAREALGTLAFLWHDSQDELKTQGTFDEIVDWCRITKLTKDDQERWIKTLCRARFLTEVETGVFLIHGNLSQIDNKLKHLNKSRKGGEATRLKWEMRREGHSPTTGIATGLAQVGQRGATGRLNAMQGNAMQENNTCAVSSDDSTPRYDLERIYQEYPKRRGSQNKAKGLERLKKMIKTDADYEIALESVRRYKSHLISENKIGTEFVKMFSSFWDLLGDWREWATREAAGHDGADDAIIEMAFGRAQA